MRYFLTCAILAACTLLSGSPAFAQGFVSGQVYDVAPNGVYVQNPQGIAFVPSASATFRVGRAVVNLAALGVGTPVQAYYQPRYQPQYVPVEYYQSHPRNWGWDRNWRAWQQDRRYWAYERGRWHDNRGHHNNGHHNGHHDNGRRHGHGDYRH